MPEGPSVVLELHFSHAPKICTIEMFEEGLSEQTNLNNSAVNCSQSLQIFSSHLQAYFRYLETSHWSHFNVSWRASRLKIQTKKYCWPTIYGLHLYEYILELVWILYPNVMKRVAHVKWTTVFSFNALSRSSVVDGAPQSPETPGEDLLYFAAHYAEEPHGRRRLG